MVIFFLFALILQLIFPPPEIDHRIVKVPLSLQVSNDSLSYGGDIRIANFGNQQQLGVLVYRTANYVDGGASQPCFMAAFSPEGEIHWQFGEGGGQPNRPGPVIVVDLDGDGVEEVVALFTEQPDQVDPHSMAGMQLMVVDAKTGRLENKAAPPEITSATGQGPNWVHQRFMAAKLNDANQKTYDLIIKLGQTVVALDHNLNVLWTYFNPWDEYQNCPAYIPAIGDIDGDGKDEINGGYYLLDDDGTVLWEQKLGKNMDSVWIGPWENDSSQRAFCSGYGHIMDADGQVILKLGAEVVPHGQELRVAHFNPEYPGQQMMIRHRGHQPDVMLVGQEGQILNEFRLNDSPNHTGMEVVYLNGRDQPALLFNGGVMWKGDGHRAFTLPGLPDRPAGPFRQGWYHCIPLVDANTGSEGMVVYNPWESRIYLYYPRGITAQSYHYQPHHRTFNARLLD